MTLRPHHLLIALAALCVLAAPATAQLELPDRPVSARGTKAGGSKGGSELRLPGGKQPAQPTGAPSVGTTRPERGISSAAEFVLAEVAKLESVDHVIVEHGIRSLVALGDSGRAAARLALASDRAPSVILGASVLMESPEPADHDLVTARALKRLPSDACAPLVDLIAADDPVRASPRLFAQLLMHPQTPMRAAAHRHLEGIESPSLLAALMPVLEAKSSDARLRAVRLVARVKDPAVMPLLLESLKDRSSKVAARAMKSLAVLEDERLDTELLRRAFSSRWILRENAYAILTLIEREDLTLEARIGDEYTGVLLEGLGASEPLVTGACASALAGIGFRSTSPDRTEWLDREVPHRLVRIAGGEDFHNDYTVLRPVALRRLTLITDQHFVDGPSWIRWWTTAAVDFRAHRAVLAATEADAAAIVVRVLSNAARPELYRLVGPVAELGEDGARDTELGTPLAPETLRLSAGQARDLYALLGELGVFTATRLPGHRGAPGGGRVVTVSIAGGTKEFSFSRDRSEPWFESLYGAATSLRDRNRWQRYPAPEQAADPVAFWTAEHTWWDENTDEAARATRLKDMVLVALQAERPSRRSEGVAELGRLASLGGEPDLEDFAALEALLRQEKFIGPRTRQLIDLMRTSVRPVREEELGIELAGRMVDALIETFGADGAVLVAELMRTVPREFVRRMAIDDRPFVRAVSGATLAPGATEEDVALLMRLLEDPVEDVEISVVHALGENQIEAARTELLLRARVASPRVRAAALEAIGELGGEGVFDALVVGLAEREYPEVVTAAARGLSVLGDPASASILISLLSRGRESDVYEHAHRGLLALGEDAWPELLRVVHSPAHRQRREAAILLGMQGVPQAASAMMTMLTDAPDDKLLAQELAILTAVDFRDQGDPALAWWSWWEFVVHNDSLAWFRGALERLGIETPSAEAFEGEGTEEGILFLIDVLGRPEVHLAERARRELSRLLGRELGELPLPGAEREAWIEAAREAARSRWSSEGAR